MYFFYQAFQKVLDHSFWWPEDLVMGVWNVKTESVQFLIAKPSSAFYPKLPIESPWDVYKWFVENFVIFPESLGSIYLDV